MPHFIKTSSVEPAPFTEKKFTSTTTLHNNFTKTETPKDNYTFSTAKDYNLNINNSTTKLTRVDSFEADDAERSCDKEIQRSEVVKLDSPIRFSLIIVGTLSGPSVFIKPRCLRILAGVVHATLSILLLAGLATGFLCAWDETEDSGLDRLVRSLASLIITGWLGVQCSAFFVISHLKCGLIDYYKQLSKVEDCLIKLGVKIRMKRMRWFIRIVVLLSWIFALGNCGLRVLDYRIPEYDDATIGTKTENSASELQLILIKLVVRTAVSIVTLHWVYGQAYFVSICFVLWTLLSDYNKCLESDINNSAARVFQNLEAYRKAHLDLCDLVERVDILFRFKFGILVGGNTLILLCILYLASVSVNNPELYDFGIYFFYIIMSVAALVIIIFFCHKVFNETTEGYKIIQRVIQTEVPVTNLQIYQMQLFQNRIQTPEPLTAVGLLDINKELGMTLVGVIVSYYLVMVQFNSLPDNPQTNHCNCTTIQNTTPS